MQFVSIFICSLLFGYSVFAAFSRGGEDFNVFYTAWHLAWNGGAQDVYHATPDRFLYAPGFAWAFAPLGALPRDLALAFWCALKVFALGLILVKLDPIRLSVNKTSSTPDRFQGMALGAWGILLFARPVLIDIQYGQVNLLISAFAFLALLQLVESRLVTQEDWSKGSETFWLKLKTLFGYDWLIWFLAGFGALTKVMTLPLLIPPLYSFLRAPSGYRRQRLPAVLGLMMGVLVALFLPAVSVGWTGTFRFWQDWVIAVQARGLPLETHNQSFVAIIAHFFDVDPIPAVALGGWRVVFGIQLLKPATIVSIGWAWFVTAAIGLLMMTTLGFPKSSQRICRVGESSLSLRSWRWAALVVGLTVLPSHLIWKPYFVFGIPAAVLAVHEVRAEISVGKFRNAFLLVLLGVLINFTSIDSIGLEAGLWCEAVGVLFWSLVALLSWHAWRFFSGLSSSFHSSPLDPTGRSSPSTNELHKYP